MKINKTKINETEIKEILNEKQEAQIQQNSRKLMYEIETQRKSKRFLWNAESLNLSICEQQSKDLGSLACSCGQIGEYSLGLWLRGVRSILFSLLCSLLSPLTESIVF